MLMYKTIIYKEATCIVTVKLPTIIYHSMTYTVRIVTAVIRSTNTSKFPSKHSNYSEVI